MLSPTRSYRRYKHNNKFDAPLTIFLIDGIIRIAKLLLIVLLIGAIWMAGMNIVNRMNSRSTSIVQLVEQQASGASQPDTVVKVASAGINLEVAQLDAKPVALADELVLAAKTTGTETDIIADAATKSETPANTEILDGEWLATLNPNQFIVQFGSSPDLELLEEYAAEINTGQPIAIYAYATTPSGKPIYGVASSLHDDVYAGLAFVEHLPDSLRQFDPWVRQVKTLQQQIDADR